MATRFETIVVSPDLTFSLPHLAGHLSTSPCEKHLVAFSPEDPTVSVFSDTWQCQRVHLPKPTGTLCMSIDPTGKLLAFANSGEDRLHIWNLDTNQQVTVQHQAEVVDARFDRRGRLWSVCRGAERFIVELRSAGDWQLGSSVEVSDDYFREGGAELRLSQSDDLMFVGVYSGQSEQENYLCQAGPGAISARALSAMDGEQFVFASPRCPTVVTLDHETCSVLSFQQPFSTPLDRLPWPDYIEEECDDERPGYFGCYAGEDHFLASSSEGRLFLFQLTPLHVRREIHIAGFRPVPASVKYPSLSDASGLVSDLTMLARCGESVAVFFAKNHRSHPQLAIVPIAKILG